jgi:DUF4097 and DUF4098 domain-containing protein YvlB
MPTESYRFPTDGPVHLRLRSNRGTVEVTADDVPETLVDISGRHDVGIVRVSASADGREVIVEVPKTWRPGGHPRFDITVRLPKHSVVDLSAASASITTKGILAGADAQTASGKVLVEQVEGDADVKTASGAVHLGTIGGSVKAKSASGDLHVARVGGACTAVTASGAIDIGWAEGDAVTASSASGRVTVRDAVQGEVTCRSTSGSVAIGVRKGTLVWLDLTTVSGRTSSTLSPEDGPRADEERVLRVKAQTVSGNIAVSPSGADAAAA